MGQAPIEDRIRNAIGRARNLGFDLNIPHSEGEYHAEMARMRRFHEGLDSMPRVDPSAQGHLESIRGTRVGKSPTVNLDAAVQPTTPRASRRA